MVHWEFWSTGNKPWKVSSSQPPSSLSQVFYFFAFPISRLPFLMIMSGPCLLLDFCSVSQSFLTFVSAIQTLMVKKFSRCSLLASRTTQAMNCGECRHYIRTAWVSRFLPCVLPNSLDNACYLWQSECIPLQEFLPIPMLELFPSFCEIPRCSHARRELWFVLGSP